MHIYKTIISFLFSIFLVVKCFAGDTTDQIAIIVRIPTYAPKIKYLDHQIHQNKGYEKKVKNYAKIKKDLEHQRDMYLSLLSDVFREYYTASEVYFVPDTLYKNIFKGDTRVFISESGDIVRKNLDGKILMYMIQGKDEYQLLLTNQDHQQQEKPWPYKKGTFLATFKRLFNKESYIKAQIMWFDEKMKMAIKLYNLR